MNTTQKQKSIQQKLQNFKSCKTSSMHLNNTTTTIVTNNNTQISNFNQFEYDSQFQKDQQNNLQGQKSSQYCSKNLEMNELSEDEGNSQQNTTTYEKKKRTRMQTRSAAAAAALQASQKDGENKDCLYNVKARKRESISSIDNNICSPNRNDFNDHEDEKQKYNYLQGDRNQFQGSPLNDENGNDYAYKNKNAQMQFQPMYEKNAQVDSQNLKFKEYQQYQISKQQSQVQNNKHQEFYHHKQICENVQNDQNLNDHYLKNKSQKVNQNSETENNLNKVKENLKAQFDFDQRVHKQKEKENQRNEQIQNYKYVTRSCAYNQIGPIENQKYQKQQNYYAIRMDKTKRKPIEESEFLLERRDEDGSSKAIDQNASQPINNKSIKIQNEENGMSFQNNVCMNLTGEDALKGGIYQKRMQDIQTKMQKGCSSQCVQKQDYKVIQIMHINQRIRAKILPGESFDKFLQKVSERVFLLIFVKVVQYLDIEQQQLEDLDEDDKQNGPFKQMSSPDISLMNSNPNNHISQSKFMNNLRDHNKILSSSNLKQQNQIKKSLTLSQIMENFGLLYREDKEKYQFIKNIEEINKIIIMKYDQDPTSFEQDANKTSQRKNQQNLYDEDAKMKNKKLDHEEKSSSQQKFTGKQGMNEEILNKEDQEKGKKTSHLSNKIPQKDDDDLSDQHSSHNCAFSSHNGIGNSFINRSGTSFDQKEPLFYIYFKDKNKSLQEIEDEKQSIKSDKNPKCLSDVKEQKKVFNAQVFYNDQLSAKFGALNAEEIENINNEDLDHSVVLMNGQINPEDFINGMTPTKNRVERKNSHLNQRQIQTDQNDQILKQDSVKKMSGQSRSPAKMFQNNECQFEKSGNKSRSLSEWGDCCYKMAQIKRETQKNISSQDKTQSSNKVDSHQKGCLSSAEMLEQKENIEDPRLSKSQQNQFMNDQKENFDQVDDKEDLIKNNFKKCDCTLTPKNDEIRQGSYMRKFENCKIQNCTNQVDQLYSNNYCLSHQNRMSNCFQRRGNDCSQDFVHDQKQNFRVNYDQNSHLPNLAAYPNVIYYNSYQNSFQQFEKIKRPKDEKKILLCPFQKCLKEFTETGNLKTHMRTHTGERPFVCIECSQKFITKGHLQAHELTHTGEKPFVCTMPGCNKRYSRAGRLKIHMRLHTGERPFVCPEDGCEKAFREKGNLLTHMRIHNGQKPFKCDFADCDNSFSTWGFLQEHKKRHDGERPYICGYCNNKFLRSSTLSAHMKKHCNNYHFNYNQNEHGNSMAYDMNPNTIDQGYYQNRMHNSNMNNANIPEYYKMGVESQGKFQNSSGMQMGINSSQKNFRNQNNFQQSDSRQQLRDSNVYLQRQHHPLPVNQNQKYQQQFNVNKPNKSSAFQETQNFNQFQMKPNFNEYIQRNENYPNCSYFQNQTPQYSSSNLSGHLQYQDDLSQQQKKQMIGQKNSSLVVRTAHSSFQPPPQNLLQKPLRSSSNRLFNSSLNAQVLQDKTNNEINRLSKSIVNQQSKWSQPNNYQVMVPNQFQDQGAWRGNNLQYPNDDNFQQNNYLFQNQNYQVQQPQYQPIIKQPVSSRILSSHQVQRPHDVENMNPNIYNPKNIQIMSAQQSQVMNQSNGRDPYIQNMQQNLEILNGLKIQRKNNQFIKNDIGKKGGRQLHQEKNEDDEDKDLSDERHLINWKKVTKDLVPQLSGQKIQRVGEGMNQGGSLFMQANSQNNEDINLRRFRAFPPSISTSTHIESGGINPQQNTSDTLIAFQNNLNKRQQKQNYKMQNGYKYNQAKNFSSDLSIGRNMQVEDVIMAPSQNRNAHNIHSFINSNSVRKSSDNKR